MALVVRNNIKYKKIFRKKNYLFRNTEYKEKSSSLIYGFYGLCLKESGTLTFKQLESARRVISRYSRRKCKVWFRVFPDRPVTSKSKASRMGKGVGKIDYWVFDAKSGRIVLEISFVNYKLAKKLLLAASKKLPLKSLFVFRIKKKEHNLIYETSKYL